MANRWTPSFLLVRRSLFLSGYLLAVVITLPVAGSDLDEFKIKRQPVFEFTVRPQVRKAGNAWEITFTSKAFCDVAVAIEDADGRIARHLASGVLGKNTPPKFQKNSLQQAVLWDGKDDRGQYVENPSGCSVRVSLGLKPEFERKHFWSPKKRLSRANRPLIAAAPEGVYVFEGEGADHIRLFDHDGNYVRTVYPFSARKLSKVNGLKWATFPQDGKKLPLKHGLVQATLFTSGRNIYDSTMAKYQPAATAFDVRSRKIALASERLNRFVAGEEDSSLNLNGPAACIEVRYANQEFAVTPRSAALSPDGRWVYMTGYQFTPKYPRPRHWLPCLTRLEYANDKAKLEVIAGSAELNGFGTESREFRAPMSVDCDAEGRIYVADYMNDRIQVFDPDGAHLKSILVKKPAEVRVHQRSGEIHVTSWMALNRLSKPKDVDLPRYTRLGPFDQPKVISSMPLPLNDHNSKVFMNRHAGFQYSFELDSWSDPPILWLVPAALGSVSKLLMVRGKMDQNVSRSFIRLLVEKDGKLIVKRDFGKEVLAAIKRTKPPIHSRQKMYVNPADGRLYIFEGQAGVAKSCKTLLSIDPVTGEIGELVLPFDAEDLAFDIRGMIYLRTDNVVGRFDPKTWREIPFDYGEERKSVGFSASRDGRRRSLISAIVMPAQRPGCFHQGGMSVGPNGHLVVSCYNIATAIDRKAMREIKEAARAASGKEYAPEVYSGRERWGEIHVWDEHGQLIHEDAVPGATMMDGIAIDNEDSIYLLHTANRVHDGEPYFLERAETLIKARPNKARLISDNTRLPIPMGTQTRPKRPPEFKRHGDIWIEGQEWLYGGVGFGGFNSSKGGGGCACWHARFALDNYARSFVPEVDHFSIAVLDTAGNLILRIGQYGNADDGKPLVQDGGSPNTRSIGGDEIALFHAAYVAIHTDRRLFISDGGNARILSVKLDYHRTVRVALEGTNGK